MNETDKYNRELSKHDIDCDLTTKRRKQQLRLGIQIVRIKSTHFTKSQIKQMQFHRI